MSVLVYLQARTARLLLMAGADPIPYGANAEYPKAQEPRPQLRPEMLLLNAVQCEEYPERPMLLQLLLARGGDVLLEEVWPDTGETALCMAVGYDDIEVRTNYATPL